jgi:hypothetical protein
MDYQFFSSRVSAYAGHRRLAAPPTATGDWAWCSDLCCYIPLQRPKLVELHPLEPGDSRWARLSSGQPVSLARRSYALWAPIVRPVSSGRRRVRAHVAAWLDGNLTGIPPVFLHGEPVAVLRSFGLESRYGWIQRAAANEPVVFTTTGDDMWQLVHGESVDDFLVVELEEVS